MPWIDCWAACRVRKNRLKTWLRSRMLMPMPVSRTTSSTRSWVTERSTSIRPPAGVYLTAFESRLSTTWENRCGSTLTTSCFGSRVARVRPAPLDRGPGRLDRLPDQSGDVGALALEVHQAALDLGGLQQVGDQPVQPVDVPLDHAELVRPPRRAGRRARGPGW